MKFIPTAILVFALASPLQAEPIGPPIGDAIRDVPIFDAHMHYKQLAWAPYPVDAVIGLMDANRVAIAAVSSTPDEGTIRLWKYAPARITPVLRPYHDGAGSTNWTKAPGMQAYIQKRIAEHSHKGIGEFHLNDQDPEDRPLLREIARIALARNIPLHIHSGADPVRMMFEVEPRLTILWAHAGMTESPETVDAMLNRYPKLYADTSYRELDILTGASEISPEISPAWRAVITKHADRLMVGTDTWINNQWDNYAELIALNRQWLATLPRDIAERIAYKNAERLFGRKVTPALFGTTR